jgi:virginiamycin B lyase
MGRIDTRGNITEFEVPTPDAYPQWIVTGSDGNLWFNEAAAYNLGRITTAGAITEYQIPGDGISGWITQGPDHALWFVELLTGSFAAGRAVPPPGM